MAPVLGGAEKCPRCSQSVYFAEEARAMGKKYHKQCLKCTECGKTLDSTNCNDHDNDIYCNGCYRSNFGINSAAMSIQADSGQPMGVSSAPAGVDQCFRCGKAVYMAERLAGGKQYFHKSCYRCKTCGVGLDSNRLAIREEEIYCKSCYGKNFGPKGYGFAGGAGGLSMDTGKMDEIPTSHIPATAQAHTAPLAEGAEEDVQEGDWSDDRERCLRCKRPVYFAERIMGYGKVFHRACFKCQNEKCNKHLDSTTMTEHDGQIFCKSCYSRNFGPKGFGFGTSMITEQTQELSLTE